MFFGLAISAIAVGPIARFYLIDSPGQAKRPSQAKQDWLSKKLESPASGPAKDKIGLGPVFIGGRSQILAAIIWGPICDIYDLACFCQASLPIAKLPRTVRFKI